MNRLFNSFGFALRGIVSALDHVPNLRIHFSAVFVMIVFGLFFSIHAWEWCVMILCFAMVISLEMVNTSIEEVFDLLHPDQHPKVKLAKDIAAGAVLIAAIASVVIACFIFIPKIGVFF